VPRVSSPLIASGTALSEFCGQTGTGTFPISLQFKVPVPSDHKTLPVYPPEQYRQRIFSTWDRYQMHMVGHHAPSQQSHVSITQIVSQEPQID
jgi:hypothetical protein